VELTALRHQQHGTRKFGAAPLSPVSKNKEREINKKTVFRIRIRMDPHLDGHPGCGSALEMLIPAPDPAAINDLNFYK